VAAGVLVRQGYGILFWINAAASVLAALIVWRHVALNGIAIVVVQPIAVRLPGATLLDHGGRTALWAACTATGLALFAAQQAVAPALRRRTTRP
jgi:hypothetical protein